MSTNVLTLVSVPAILALVNLAKGLGSFLLVEAPAAERGKRNTKAGAEHPKKHLIGTQGQFINNEFVDKSFVRFLCGGYEKF